MTVTADSTTTDAPTTTLDALIVGAGVAGLYQLHQLRQLGLNVRAYDAASDVGGTWFWNRYPGARFDSEAYIYQYLFDEGLYKDWSWSKRFPDQPEIERWMHYVADRLDLRKDISFGVTITGAEWNEETGRWRVTTDSGEVIDTQFLISCAGMLSAPMSNMFPGQETFSGKVFHTSRWPSEGVDLKGKRVGVVGTGATGIQVIQSIADQVDSLTVFVRDPQYVLPMRNPDYGPEEVAAYKARFEELRDTLPHTFSGFEYDFEHVWEDMTPEQRQEVLQDTYENGSLKMWLASFSDIFFDEKISAEVSEFVRERMETRLKDPELIKVLVPYDHGFGTKRVPLENGFLETFLRDNVTAVAVRDNPISQIHPEGVELADGTRYDLDVLILATGFDAGSGALSRMGIRGRDNRSLTEEWRKDIRTTMGLAVHGYPNLLITAAPLAPSAALCNMTTCLQQQTEWITQAVGHVREKGASVIEPTAEAEQAWIDHHEETAGVNLISKTASWYTGSNVEGKPFRVLSYTGGVGEYRQRAQAEADQGYPGFDIR
ncbi:flavin-containing monooxygenase [Dermacoccaceae bacterium W4C1]